MLRFSGQKQTTKSKVNKNPSKTKVILPDNTVSSLDKCFGEKADYSSCGLTNLSSIEIPPGTKKLILDRNPIKTLSDLPSLPGLTKLSLKDTDFESFKGFPSFSNLTKIDVTGSPIASTPNLKSALLILIPTLRKINKVIVTQNERKLAASFNSRAPILLRNGWQPTLRPPSEEETDFILARLVAMNKKRISAASAQKHPISRGYAMNLSEKYQRMITAREEEIERLKKLIEERMRTKHSPLKAPKPKPKPEPEPTEEEEVKEEEVKEEELKEEPIETPENPPEETETPTKKQRRKRSPKKSRKSTSQSDTLTYETEEGSALMAEGEKQEIEDQSPEKEEQSPAKSPSKSPRKKGKGKKSPRKSKSKKSPSKTTTEQSPQILSPIQEEPEQTQSPISKETEGGSPKVKKSPKKKGKRSPKKSPKKQ